MQEYKGDKVVSGRLLPENHEDTLDVFSRTLQRLKDCVIDHVRVGRVPAVNEIVEVNGLRFTVTAAGPERFTAEMVKPT